ncbi:hypothetical protein T492DRAFT_946741 [Pavlovales sp. CCMP2436]|nr:hypothetical protein T492DRAFT_946741 [Pavlovales sp. CCMP2436]
MTGAPPVLHAGARVASAPSAMRVDPRDVAQSMQVTCAGRFLEVPAPDAYRMVHKALWKAYTLVLT